MLKVRASYCSLSFLVLTQLPYLNAMKEEKHFCPYDEMIRQAMSRVSHEMKEKLKSSTISYFNVRDDEGKLVATIDRASNRVYTYHTIHSKTLISQHSLEAFRNIMHDDLLFKNEDKISSLDEEYEQAVQQFSDIKRVYCESAESDSLLAQKKKEWCWCCCLY